MKTLFFALIQIVFLLFIVIICSIAAIIELISAYGARKSWVAKEYAKARKEYWWAFDAYALALEDNDPQSQKVISLYKRLETKSEVHEHFLKLLQAA